MVANGRMLLKVHGAEVGQVNGLSIIVAGPLTYGIPTRITACVGAGSGGVLDIDKDSELSGPVHAKGFHILESVLRGLLTAQSPLCFAGSVVFEQTYGHVDGDSAAAAEICCLLSALAQVPLRQGLALTGSVDQLGQVQPVGGVNEKIEGFFDTCATLGLDGEQGVIVPAANVGELMLRHDVVEACAARRFGVFFAATIHDAIELLSGMAAGTANPKGEYPEGTFLRIAVDRARALAEACKQAG
jgi:predicted ATP-dependent protease